MIHKSHDIRSSDSSFYDVVCKKCEATDRTWDDRLLYPCTKDAAKGFLQLKQREASQLKDKLKQVQKDIKTLKKNKPT